MILLRKEYRYDLLMVDSNKFDSLNQAIYQLLYLTLMLNYYTRDRNIGALLDAYVDYHRTICKRPDCPCVAKNLNQKKIKRFIKNLKVENNDEEIKDSYVILVYIIERVFILSLSRFPSCIQLRINHALFLLDKMSATQQALFELSLAEAEKPYIDEQFMIYRYKKVIEQQIIDTRQAKIKQNKNNNDVVDEISSESQMKELQSNIELSTVHHMEFWSQLSEDVPDLVKLFEIGAKVNYSTKMLKDNWNKIIKMNLEIASSIMRTYAKYLLAVLHDTESAFQVVKKLKQIQNFNATNRDSKFPTNVNDFVTESVGIVAISGEDATLGRIIGVNMSCSNIFGYSKTELINRKINIVQPQLISEIHDDILESYLHRLSSKILGNEFLVLGKIKHGYICPISLYIKTQANFNTGAQFFSSIKQDKYFKIIAHMIVNKNSLEILNISSNCISLFGLTVNYVTKQKPKITEIIPDFFANKNDYLGKGGLNEKIEYHIKESQKKPQFFNIQVQQVKALEKLAYYQIKFERQSKGNTDTRFQQQSESVVDYNNNESYQDNSVVERYSTAQQKQLFFHPAFVFQFDVQNMLFLGEFIIPVNFDLLNSSNRQILDDLGGDKGKDNKKLHAPDTNRLNTSNILPENTLDYTRREQVDMVFNLAIKEIGEDMEDDENERKLKDFEDQKINYGANIRTMQYFNGMLIDIEDVKIAEFTEEDEEEDLNKYNAQNDIYGEGQTENEVDFNDKTNIYKSRKQFTGFLEVSKTTYYHLIYVFQWVGLLFLAIMAILALLSYFQTQSRFDKINTDYSYVEQSTQRLDEIQRILFKLTNYRLVNYKVLVEPENLPLDRQNIKDTIDDLDIIQEILQEKLDIDEIGQKQYDLQTEDAIKMQILEANQDITVVKLDLNQGTSSIIEKSFTLASMDISKFNDENPDLYYIEHALLNDYYKAVEKSSQLYVENLEGFNQGAEYQNIIISFSIILLAISVIFPIFYIVRRNIEEILKLFLQIPLSRVKLIFTSAETFLNTIQIGDEDEEEGSDQDNLENDKEDEADYGIGRRLKKRKSKYESNDKRAFLLKFSVVLLFIEAYYLVMYFLNIQISQNMEALVKEMDFTTQAQPYYTFANNVIRKVFMDQEFEVNGKDSMETIDEILEIIYNLNSQIQSEHSFNMDYHSDTYAEFFEKVMEVNICDISDQIEGIQKSECNSFNNGILKEGLAPALTRLFEQMRYLITLYKEFQDDPNTEFPTTQNYITDIFPDDLKKNKIANLLQTDSAININNMQDDYFRFIFKALIKEFQSSIQSQINSSQTTKITLFIIFLVLLTFIFIAFWIPLSSKMQREIKRTQLMLGIIPLTLITKNREIKEFINRQMKIE